MKSLDTNLLLYAINEDCPEHENCAALVRDALSENESWIIADQVWFELYRLLRNPAVLAKPLNASEAADTVAWYRQKSGWLHCAWECDLMPRLTELWKLESFPARRSFDLVLAVTLRANGVKQFYTRNPKDFDDLGFFTVTNPLESRS
ncbi:MAG: PIN domain-containing protein [Treponemataceae bacterium]